MGKFSRSLSKRRIVLPAAKDRPKGWQHLRRRGIAGIPKVDKGPMTQLRTAPPVTWGPQKSATVSVINPFSVEEKKLPGAHWAWKKKKPAAFDPDASDADGDGMVQEGTTQERPGKPKFAPPTGHPKPTPTGPKPTQWKPKPKPLQPPAVKPVWKVPVLGKRMVIDPDDTSKVLFDKKDGRYFRQRRQLHKAIVQHYLDKAGKPKPEGERTVYFLGGGPSSLKSTALASGKTNVPKDAVVVDTDEIKEFLPEYRHWAEIGVVDAASLVHDESKHITALVTQALLDHGSDIVYDTTGDGNYKGFKERIAGLRSNGHRVVANYMTNDVTAALKLNEERFKKTGRKVPSHQVSYIHSQVSKVVPDALEDGLFDELYLYDTNDLEGGPRLIVKHAKGRTTFLDMEGWEKFRKKYVPPPPPKKYEGGSGQLSMSFSGSGKTKPRDLPPPPSGATPQLLPSPYGKQPPKDYAFYGGPITPKADDLKAPSVPLEEPRKPRRPSPPPLTGKAQKLANQSDFDWAEFRRLLDEEGYVAFDYETTGFEKPNTNAPVQVGAVRIRNGKVVARLNLHMNPGEPLSEWSKGNLKDADGKPLTDEWLASQPSAKDAHRDLAAFIGDSIIVAHNMPFDQDVMGRTMAKHGIAFKPAGTIDTLELARQIVPRKTDEVNGPDGHALNQLAEFFRMPNDGWHTADADAANASLVLEHSLEWAERTRQPGYPLEAKWQAKRFNAAMKEFEAKKVEYEAARRAYDQQQAEIAKRLAKPPSAKPPKKPFIPAPSVENMS